MVLVGYTSDEVILRWYDESKGVEMDGKTNLPEYEISGTTSMVCTKLFDSTGWIILKRVLTTNSKTKYCQKLFKLKGKSN